MALCLHAFVVDAAAVVLDFNVDVVAAMIGAQARLCRVSDLPAARRVFGVLDAVRDGIANQVHQRIGNLLNDVVVELGFAAGEVEIDLFAGGFARRRERRATSANRACRWAPCARR